MSKLARAQGDDFPEAASKHLNDAGVLLGSGQADGAAYLSGYVVECSLKSIIQLETGAPPQAIHGLVELVSQVLAVAATAGSKTARYLGPATRSISAASIRAWHPAMRYRAPFMAMGDAQAWHQEAAAVYQEVIAQMRLNGEV